MHQVQKSIDPNLQIFFSDTENIWDIYKYSEASVVFGNTSALILCQLPLADKINSFILTRGLALELPLFYQKDSAEGFSIKYDLDSEYLITNSELFAIIDYDTYHKCQKGHGRYCAMVQLFRTLDLQSSCLFAHYITDAASIKQHCSLQIKPAKFPFVNSLTKTYWLVATPNKLVLLIVCPDKTYRENILPPFRLIKLPIGCTAYSDKFKIFAQGTATDSVHINLDVFSKHLPTIVDLNRFDIFIHKNSTSITLNSKSLWLLNFWAKQFIKTKKYARGQISDSSWSWTFSWYKILGIALGILNPSPSPKLWHC